MSNVSPVPGAAISAATSSQSDSTTSFSSSSQQQQHNHHHPHPHHSSSQDVSTSSGMPHSSFDSIASHHEHQAQHSSQHNQQQEHHHHHHQQQQQQQQQQQHHQHQQQQQQHQHSNPHPSSNGHAGANSWGSHPQQPHYGGSNYPSHAVYSSPAYYSNQSSNSSSSNNNNNNGSSANYSNGYAAYSVQPHQGGQPAASSQHPGYSNHGSAAPPSINGSTQQHSGSSTPNSTTSYARHPHSSTAGAFSTQPYHPHHHLSPGGYYGGSPSNGMMPSPSYSSGPQYGTQLPVASRHRVTTTLWEDEGTLCFQVDAKGVCVARRHDNNMINGTKLLNVCGMSRGKRDGILKNEKERIVVKVGAMHLKGVWITFLRGRTLAEQNDILDVLYPLFETNIQSFLYHPDNYPRTAAVIAAAQERNTQRSRIPGGTGSPVSSYPPIHRASSHSAGPIPGTIPPQHNPPPLMRANTSPSGPMMNNNNNTGPINGSLAAYHQSNGYSSGPNHSQQHSPYAHPTHNVSIRSGGREEMESSTVKSEVVDDSHTSASNGGGARVHYYSDDIKAPLSDSAQLNSSSPYAFHPVTNVPLKHLNRNEQSGGDGNVGMMNLPTWTYRGSNNVYSRQQ